MTYSEYVHQDVRMDYYKPFCKCWWLDRILKTEQYYLRRYVVLLRSEEYYSFIKPNKMLHYYFVKKKNILGVRLGFFIPAGCFGPDLKIWHYGSIIVNPHAKIGKGCTIHGNCCIGNKGLKSCEGDSPVIGDYVNIGQGAQILGSVTIADNVLIAAGAVVVKPVSEPGLMVIGVPARII